MATGLARVLSKHGICSRTEACEWIRNARVQVNGRVIRDPEHPVRMEHDRVLVDGQSLQKPRPIYLMLNKPRGLVTTARDERGRPTVFSCFNDAGLPPLHAVGRLDQASEGLLLFTNDTQWSARITDPQSHVDKTYHVQVKRVIDAEQLALMQLGVEDEGERIRVKRADVLRSGGKTCWLEIVLDEGRNRHIRRLLRAMDIEVMRLVRVRIGNLELGDLAKGAWRHLDADEVEQITHRSN